MIYKHGKQNEQVFENIRNRFQMKITDEKANYMHRTREKDADSSIN